MDLEGTRRVASLTREVRELRSALFKVRSANSRENLASAGNPLDRAFIRNRTGAVYEVSVNDSGTVTATKVR